VHIFCWSNTVGAWDSSLLLFLHDLRGYPLIGLQGEKTLPGGGQGCWESFGGLRSL
jgi:hypothetical protein